MGQGIARHQTFDDGSLHRTSPTSDLCKFGGMMLIFERSNHQTNILAGRDEGHEDD